MNVWSPDVPGIFFSLQSQPEETQQRERICVCSGGNYPIVEFSHEEETKQKPEFVEVILVGWNATLGRITERPTPKKMCLTIWNDGASVLEIHPKTPSLLSNFQDHREKCASGFFFIIKIMTSDDQEGYKIMDVITTKTFRTVSHSKLCPVTHRGRSRRRPARREKFSESRDRSPVRLRKRIVGSESSLDLIERIEENDIQSFESPATFENSLRFEDFGVDNSIGLPLELF